jgi:hypothetical protein
VTEPLLLYTMEPGAGNSKVCRNAHGEWVNGECQFRCAHTRAHALVALAEGASAAAGGSCARCVSPWSTSTAPGRGTPKPPASGATSTTTGTTRSTSATPGAPCCADATPGIALRCHAGGGCTPSIVSLTPLPHQVGRPAGAGRLLFFHSDPARPARLEDPPTRAQLLLLYVDSHGYKTH